MVLLVEIFRNWLEKFSNFGYARSLPKRACLYSHIDLCTAPCIGKVSDEEYQKQVEQARVFLNGDYEQTLERLNEQMQDASNRQNYEYALELQKHDCVN